MRLTVPLRALKFGVALSLAAATSAYAEDKPDPANPDIEEGTDLLERGARLLFEGLLEEMSPALDELQNFTENMAPVFEQMMNQMGEAFMVMLDTIDSIEYYEAPVILDNGDILIQRKPDAPDWSPPDDRLLKPDMDTDDSIDI